MISELCAGRATKNVCVETNNNRDALLSNWGQTDRLFKLERDICGVTQVTQSVDCALVG